MPIEAGSRMTREGAWHFVFCPNAWSGELQKKVIELVNEQPSSAHPQTVEFDWPARDGDRRYYLKVFHGIRSAGIIKDLFRSSKAMRFWRVGANLSAAGLNGPPTIAAGEQRYLRFIRRAFVLTAKVEGQPLPAYLADLAQARDKRSSLRLKRTGLVKLARLIREFHGFGFVHGDMVASNLFISSSAGDEIMIYFMDNDRTRRYPTWLPQSMWKRNLIQLNRMPLPSITLQDRVRFLQAYLGNGWRYYRKRRLAKWFEAKTRKRRKECDGVDPTLDFRKLMQWNRASS